MPTKIAWCKETWNPVTGCIDVQCHPERLDQPLHWAKPRMVFVNSMSDLFHEDVPSSFIKQIFNVMLNAEQHTFQILTKRPRYMLNWFNEFGHIFSPTNDPLPNVWLGVSIEDQQTADERIPLLLQTPAAIRWISAEPLLNNIELERGRFWLTEPDIRLNWCVVGGESGPRARTMSLSWARNLRDECKESKVPFFMKQLSQHDSKSFNQFDTFPDDLQIREYPNG